MNRQHGTPRPHVGTLVRKGTWWAAWVLITAALPRSAEATWSIILIDTESREIAVGSATCLTNFDLQRWLPVVRVDVGAACAQSSVDNMALNRMQIWDQLIAGTDPAAILEVLAGTDNAHQSRQYGIADVFGRAATFTGSQAADWAGGVTGVDGSVIYAVQGNILTGEAVVDQAVDALLNTPGDLPARLMAAMQAARSMGGDGRCSCSPTSPTSCGAPPDFFTKSAHIAFMIDARSGDQDGVCNLALGCATGDYFMEFNVPFQQPADPDPVLQIQQQFDAWRADHIGRPDAVHSMTEVTPRRVPATEGVSATLTIQLRDWQDAPVPSGEAVLTVQHADDSAGISTIGDITDLGNGEFSLTLTPKPAPGIDRFVVTADDGIRPVRLIPFPELSIDRLGDGTGDGAVDLADLPGLLACLAAPQGPACDFYDLNQDELINVLDFGGFQTDFTGPCPVIMTQPESVTVCPSQPVTFAVEVSRPDVTYQWRRNGQDIPGATSATLHIPTASATVTGSYTVRVSGLCGSITSEPASLALIPGPVITSDPSSFDVCLGASIQLCVAATGHAPLSYEWALGSSLIPGANEPCIQVDVEDFSDTGNYIARVTDGCGSRAESDPGRIRALNARITLQPQSQNVCTDDIVFLSVQAANATGYQWRKDGVDIPGATMALYIIGGAGLDDAGAYTCAVSSLCGPTISEPAVIQVKDCP